MIIVFKDRPTQQDVEFVAAKVTEFGYEPRIIQGAEQTVIAAVGDETTHKSLEILRGLPMIQNVMPVQKRYKLVSKVFNEGSSQVTVGEGNLVGDGEFLTIAGPCSVESREQLRQSVKDLVACGIKVIRGGAYKPRTSPYDFQGLGEEGLDLLAEVKAEFGVAIVTEIVGVPHVQKVSEVADMLQIGARNCQNYNLLEEVAGAGRPVLLKRGMATTVEEWLSAAEYLLVNGCENVVLCERGIRTFERTSRNTLDLNSVAVAKRETHLPVMVDPSHAAGVEPLVLPLAKAAIAVGADGLIVESHPKPSEACSDAAQQIPSGRFQQFLDELQPLIDVCQKRSA